MRFQELGRLVAVCLSLAAVSELAYRGWLRWRCPKPPARKRRSSVHDVIMFRPHEEGARLKRSKYSRCLITPQLDRVMSHLSSARHSLDCAIYVMTSVDLANILVRLLRCGVAVRCLVDADMAYSTGAQVRRVEKAGALIRWRKSTNLMHHKFCIMDANAVDAGATPKILTGSLNWTTQALNGNWENVVVTSQENIVALYKAEFERLWNEFRIILD